MRKLTIITAVLLGLTMFSTSCVRSSKTCKKNQKKVKSLRKSGALKM